MIEAFLKDYKGCDCISGKAVLDVGCGNGQISQYFSRDNNVSAVDVEDKRSFVNNDYKFILVPDEKLPFEDDLFDIVISHHVIEHVNDQKKHVSEIARILKSNGLLYIGCPKGYNSPEYSSSSTTPLN